MTVQLSPVPLDSFALLQQAAIAYRLGQSQRPSATEVVAALLTLEKAAKAQPICYPFSALAHRSSILLEVSACETWIFRGLKTKILRKSTRNQLKTDLFTSRDAPLNLAVQY